MGEFELIATFFTRPVKRAVLGVGDDCAILQPTAGNQLAISTDMLVSGRHFFPDVDPFALGHKALAVNLSDLAACGAKPLAFTLALALPDADPAWLAPFARGMLALADEHDCELIGGDTTKGPLNICITVFGEVPQGQGLLRSGAKAGDDMYVSGTLGDAYLALQCMSGKLQLPVDAMKLAKMRLEQPTPRVALGMALRGVASAAADISDGLLGDLGHILERSGVGATVDVQAASRLLGVSFVANEFAPALVQKSILAGGDDYELVFTASPEQRAQVQEAALSVGVPVTRIGRIDKAHGLRLVDGQGRAVSDTFASFDHFVS